VYPIYAYLNAHATWEWEIPNKRKGGLTVCPGRDWIGHIKGWTHKATWICGSYRYKDKARDGHTYIESRLQFLEKKFNKGRHSLKREISICWTVPITFVLLQSTVHMQKLMLTNRLGGGYLNSGF